MRSMLRVVLLWLVPTASALDAMAQAAPASQPPGVLGEGLRPRVGLVLSSDGACGFAHVGVLKVLEAERIPIDVIVGTSMGAIVGGHYASGMPADELDAELRRVNWSVVFAPRVERQHLSQRRKEEDFDLSPALELGLRDGEVRTPVGAASARGLEILLWRYTLPVWAVQDFDRLPIPFRAVATDLETGAAVVLDRGDLALALRSSMSVPGLFSPTEVGGRILGDGGLVNNVPADVARGLGVDAVIVVNIGTPLAGRETLGSVVGVTAQMINILTEQNVQRSLAALGSADVLVAPQLGSLGAADFEKVAEAIELGRRGAFAALERLHKYAVTPEAYALWLEEHPGRRRPEATVGFTAFEGSTLTHPGRFSAQLAQAVAGRGLHLSNRHRPTRRTEGVHGARRHAPRRRVHPNAVCRCAGFQPARCGALRHRCPPGAGTALPLHHPPGVGQRTRAVQRRQASRA